MRGAMGGARGRRRWPARLVLAGLVLTTALLAATTVAVVRSATDRSPDRSVAVQAELRALGRALDDGAGQRMQAAFPEGFAFAHVLHGLAWTDLAAQGQADPGHARERAARALERLSSPEGLAPFEASLRPPYGVFHAGWTLLLRAQLAAIEPNGAESHRLAAEQARSVALAFTAALDAGRSPFLEAYPGRSWPVDSVVAMAALRATDRATGTDHGPLIERWLARVRDLVDPATGLLPHAADPVTGTPQGGPRGSSQALIQRFWPVVDPAGAPAAYGRFRELFVAGVAGGVGVREHLPGVDAPGDVDSGPLVAGLSTSASAVAIGAARVNGDPGLATALTQEAEVLGLTVGGERRYVFGVLPVADAFLAWARAAPPAPEGTHPDLIVWWPLLLVPPWVGLVLVWRLALVVRRRRRAREPTFLDDGDEEPTTGGPLDELARDTDRNADRDEADGTGDDPEPVLAVELVGGPHTADAYAGEPYAADGYAGDPHDDRSYGVGPHPDGAYDELPYAPGPYPGDPYDDGAYANDRFPGEPYAGDPYDDGYTDAPLDPRERYRTADPLDRFDPPPPFRR